MRARLILDAAKIIGKEIGNEAPPGNAETCVKVKTNPTLLETDCKHCPERQNCSLRANTVSSRLSAYSQRVSFISMLHSWGQTIKFGPADLKQDEIIEMGIFRTILGEVTSRMEKELAEIKRLRNA